MDELATPICQKNDGQQPLFTVRTDNAGKALQQAIVTSPDLVLMTRLSNTISPSYAHAIDVRYHKACWARHVFHVLRDDTNQCSPTNAITMFDWTYQPH